MVTIREAVLNDVYGLMDLYQNHLTQRPTCGPQDALHWSAMLAALVNNPDYHLLIVDEDGKAVSSVTLVIIPNLTHNMRPYALIENVVTHGEHRGQGHASRLMEAAYDIAKTRGCYKIMLMTGSKEPATLRFYERCGFNSEDKTGFVRWL